MGLGESIRLALEGLRANKMRSLLTMLGIIIGIGAVIGILTVGNGLTGSITGSMSNLGASNITVSLRKLDDGMGGMSSLFCILLHKTEHTYSKLFTNPYLRIAVAGAVIVVLAGILSTDMYLGSGMGIIEHIFHEGETPWYSFALKMLFTALTLGAGFKGGEIVPSFTIGAALGCTLAGILGLPVELAAACGMVGLFCGVTNSPITSLLIAFELFGFEGMPYYLLTVAVSYMTSGYHSLYHKQQIVVSKTRNDYAVHWDAGKKH